MVVDTDVMVKIEEGSMAMNGGEPADGGGAKRRRIKVELESIPHEDVERVLPDGTLVFLPPENPEDAFARRVAYMRAENAKRSKNDAEREKASEDTFVWKESVDNVRAAAHHARQLSLLLELLGKRTLALAPTDKHHKFPMMSNVVAKGESVAHAISMLASASSRLQVSSINECTRVHTHIAHTNTNRYAETIRDMIRASCRNAETILKYD